MFNLSKALWRIAGFAYENNRDADWAIDEFRRFENWFYEKLEQGSWSEEEWCDRWFWATVEGKGDGWLRWSYGDEDWQRRERARQLELPWVGTDVELVSDRKIN